MVDLCVYVGRHFVRRGCTALQVRVMIAEPVQAVYNNRGIMCILGCKLTDNGNAVCDRVTCLLYLFHSRDNTMKVCLDAVCHGTVRLNQVPDGHDIADIAEYDTGELELIILHIGGEVESL